MKTYPLLFDKELYRRTLKMKKMYSVTIQVPGIILSASVVLLMVLVVLAAIIGVILYRMSMILAFSTVKEEYVQSNASLFVSGVYLLETKSLFHLILIFIHIIVFQQLVLQLI